MKPRIPLTDPSFRYKNSASTDIRKTFALARRRQRDEAEKERAAKVTPIRKVGK
jgi:hypothetical protein